MRRTAYRLAGFGCVGLGIVGAFLPLLPTTIFFILAAGFFARSSPELEARILDHPQFGPPVRAWREHGVIPPRAKAFAILGMTMGYAIFLVGSGAGPLLAAAVAVFMLASAAYVLSRPSRPG
ncbi:YbaN family protein [Polymorphum gilvum]|uniref:Putative transmembrane protein n=1 Tax=Polymorphum gilvum (strain LMG 25793 / CGMCC 1.9160 / SL003B-26A1) TaxID=991905 RepID=F2J0R6_POLGS|nr:YbaN family protein [Polymorphum gilvum]ADZ70752.1 Putative transmembrane protein [Polymorphum gilvum SL003B-26A1]